MHSSTYSKSFCPSKKKCKEYVYKGTKAEPRLVKAQHIVKISSNWSFKVIGNAPLKILKSFTLGMALSTCMQAFATLEVVLQFFLENLFLSLKNGGMISLDILLTSKSLIRCSPSIALGDEWYSSSRSNT